MADAANLPTALAELLAVPLGARDLRVAGLRRLGGGSSRENWTFEVSSRSAGLEALPLLLRRDPPASVAETDRATEVGVLDALLPTPVPAPVVVAVDLDGALLERPAVVMERAPGRADRSVLRARDPLGLGDAGRAELIDELGDLLVAVHRLDPRATGLGAVLGEAPADPAAAEIARWEAEVARRAVEPLPELVYVATWLDEHRPSPPARCTLVHGDFRPANVLVHDGMVGTLLDWEFAHLGDPAEDVGWYTVPIYRNEHFGDDGRSDAATFASRYAERAGIAPIEADRLHFWQVLAMFKLAAIAVAGLASFLTGGSDRASGPIDTVLRKTVAATMGPP